MITKILSELYERDLNKLKDELNAYSNESDLWETEGEITSSGGNLALHLIGNLRHFFGSVLGGTAYTRDRDQEFKDGGKSREKILTDIDTTWAEVKETLAKLTGEDLAKNYPVEVFGHPMTTEFFIVHLATHLNYHLGQINYHRRLLALD